MTTSPLTLDTRDAAPVRPAAATPRIDQARFAAGAMLTAGVAVLTALVGIVVARGILHLHVFGTDAAASLPYVLGVAGVAIGAALLLDAVLHVAPHPTAYFGAIAALTTALAVAIPFSTSATLADRTVLALTNLAVGAVIAILLPLAVGNARR
jgi:hypothetical protein